MKTIQLTQGYVATVDDEDFERVSAFKWFAVVDKSKRRTVHQVYARTKMGDRAIGLHRFLLNALPGQLVDHKNTDGLDCRRENLRLVTREQNGANRRKGIGTSSKFKGVTRWSRGRWRAQIQSNGKMMHLGIFNHEEDAAREYDRAAKEFFGSFALLNFPEVA